jgi:ribose/xylose/arabinose/galactoside ABC-type transport system permease subunit
VSSVFFQASGLHRVDHSSSLLVVAPTVPVLLLTVSVLLITAFVVGLALPFANGWIIAFESVTSAITLAMLSPPEAQTELIMLEEASEKTMKRVENDRRDLTRAHR